MAERVADKGDKGAREGRRGADDQAFFPGGGRKTHLEQLRHLNQWSRRILLVTGPAGAGKTVLYRQFSATLEPRAKAARVEATQANAPRELLQAMIQGFGLAAPAAADVTLLSELITAHATDQERAERHCVVLVDDADQLDHRALDLLVQLASNAPLRVVLFGEVKLVPAVERAARNHGAAWHEIRLGGFDADEVREYLAWWFRRHGHEQELPLDDGQVRQIARLSEGLPGKIEQMARVLLAKIESQGRVPPKRSFPVTHAALAGLLVALIGLIYLVWPSGAPDDAATRVVEVEVPPPQPARGVGVPPVPEPGSAASERQTSELPEPEVADGQPQAAEPPGAEPEPAAAEPELSPTPSPDEAPAAAAREPEAEPAPDTQPVPDPEPARGSAPSVAAEPTPAAEPVRAPEPATAMQTATARGVRGADWIMRQPPGAYTLQLASFSTEERARDYLSRQADPESFAAFRQQRDGRILHVVVYGRFDRRADAERAAAALPASVGRVQPWIRPFADVQAAVRTALQSQ